MLNMVRILHLQIFFQRKILIILLPLALVSTATLSFYSSPAATVDYPFIAVYLMAPALLWRTVSHESKIFWIGAGIIILTLGITQMKFLFKPQPQELSKIDYREREVIKMILEDAQFRGKSDIANPFSKNFAV